MKHDISYKILYLEVRSTGRPIYEPYQAQDQRFPFQWCSDLEHSYWQHLPFQLWVARDEIVDDRSQFLPRQQRWARDQRIQHGVHVYQHRFQRKKYWTNRHLRLFKRSMSIIKFSKIYWVCLNYELLLILSSKAVYLTNGFIAWHLPIRLNSMLKAIQLPTGIANLASCLANVDWDTFTLKSEYCIVFRTI